MSIIGDTAAMSMEDSNSNASSGGSEHTVEVELKPSVAQILSTDELPNKPVLLVDRVVVCEISHSGEYVELYRLFLSDGERTIQGMYLLLVSSLLPL